MRRGIVNQLAFLCAALGPLACQVPVIEPPRAEFLVATPDSTFWVQAGPGGIRVRGVPMTVASYGGRFHEVYVAGIDRSYTDAVFVGERLYQRDLLTGDSSVVLDDSAIVALANRFVRDSPESQLLDPDDPDPEDPLITANGETDILGVRGPFVLIEHRMSIEHGDGGEYDTTRTAIDLRGGRTMPPGTTLRDVAAYDSNTALPLPREWRRVGYDLVVRRDSVSGQVSLVLRDGLKRSWAVLTLSAAPRLYWLDAPAIDSATRAALTHAFNEAAAYDEAVRYTSLPTPFSHEHTEHTDTHGT